MEDSGIECVLHPVGYDEDCEHCESELATMQKRYDKMVKANIACEQRINSNGVGLDQGAFFGLRMAMLTDLIFQGNAKARMRFEIAYAQQCGQFLMNAEQESNRARLMNGVQGVRLK